MIVTIVVHRCPSCHSANIVKNGHTCYGAQRCLCHAYGKTRVSQGADAPILKNKPMIDCALRERLSLRGVCRVFRISMDRLFRRIRTLADRLPDLTKTLSPARPEDVLELDER